MNYRPSSTDRNTSDTPPIPNHNNNNRPGVDSREPTRDVRNDARDRSERREEHDVDFLEYGKEKGFSMSPTPSVEPSRPSSKRLKSGSICDIMSPGNNVERERPFSDSQVSVVLRK